MLTNERPPQEGLIRQLTGGVDIITGQYHVGVVGVSCGINASSLAGHGGGHGGAGRGGIAWLTLAW